MSRILVVVERFWPEDFLVNDLVRAWKEGGDEIEVLTQVPSYPFDKIYDGYENRRLQTTHEYLDIPVHRVNTIFGYNTSVKRKILNYLHFGWRTAVWCLWHGKRFDRVFVYHTAALTMASAVFPMKWLWRKPITIWTQDLWPDAVWGFGITRTRLRECLLNGFVRAIYACCDRIAVSCPKYVERLRTLTGREAEFIPQWDPDSSLDRVCQVGKPDKMVFMFAGNLGVPQNLPNLIEGFRIFKRDSGAAVTDVELHFLGGGVMYEKLVADCAEDKDIVFHGRKPRAEMPEWFSKADVMIISLTREYALTLPGKFQSYTKAGKAIFGVLEGSAADLILEHDLGVVVAPDDVAAIARGFAAMIKRDLIADGNRSRRLSDVLFNREKLVAALLGA